jgi:acyl carrier protein
MADCDLNELREFMAVNFLFSDEFSLDDTASFMDSGILDSVGVLQIILFLEEHYEIKLTDEEIIPENLDSIRNLASFVERKLCEKESQEPGRQPGGAGLHDWEGSIAT